MILLLGGCAGALWGVPTELPCGSNLLIEADLLKLTLVTDPDTADCKIEFSGDWSDGMLYADGPVWVTNPIDVTAYWNDAAILTSDEIQLTASGGGDFFFTDTAIDIDCTNCAGTINTDRSVFFTANQATIEVCGSPEISFNVESGRVRATYSQAQLDDDALNGLNINETTAAIEVGLPSSWRQEEPLHHSYDRIDDATCKNLGEFVTLTR